jgi:HAD superfamily hydrolase (TIGR01549 family)
MKHQQLQEGSAELLGKCRRLAIRAGVVTRNARRSVDHLCRRFGLEFDAVVTREFPVMKPHPRPVLHILEQWGLAAPDVLTIGDYLFDIQCGRTAGTRTCFFQNPGMPSFADEADFAVSSMHELDRLVFP